MIICNPVNPKLIKHKVCKIFENNVFKYYENDFSNFYKNNLQRKRNL